MKVNFDLKTTKIGPILYFKRLMTTPMRRLFYCEVPKYVLINFLANFTAYF